MKKTTTSSYKKLKERIISFKNRTYAQIQSAYLLLKSRYMRKVSFTMKLVNGLYNGSFCVL